MQESIVAIPVEAPGHASADAVSADTAPQLAPGAGLADPRAIQILTTEHYSLMAARSLAYNESFSRGGMFLSFLAATLIVIGFLIGTQGLSRGIVPVVAILLLADLFIGVATVGRLLESSIEDLSAIRGMNRIRHAYREMIPGIEPYFVTGFHDDGSGILATYGSASGPNSAMAELAHGIATTPGMISTIVAMILGALVALVAIGVGAEGDQAIVIGVAGFLLGFTGLAILGTRVVMAYQASIESNFPSPMPDDQPD